MGGLNRHPLARPVERHPDQGLWGWASRRGWKRISEPNAGWLGGVCTGLDNALGQCLEERLPTLAVRPLGFKMVVQCRRELEVKRLRHLCDSA